jgi:hypothetical protein
MSIQRVCVLLSLLFVVASMSACAKQHTNVAKLDPDNVCSPDEQCVSFISDGNDFWGGGRHKVTILHGGKSTFYDKDTKQLVTVKNSATSLGFSANADRGDTFGPELIRAGTQLGSVKIQTHSNEKIGRMQADAQKNAGPQNVFLISNNSSSRSSGGSALAVNAPGPTFAIAEQSTDVDVETNQGQSQGHKIFNPNE